MARVGRGWRSKPLSPHQRLQKQQRLRLPATLGCQVCISCLLSVFLAPALRMDVMSIKDTA